MLLNRQGLTNNFTEIKHLIIIEKNYDLIVLTETHLGQWILESEVNIRNNNIIRSESTSPHTGGIVMYLKKCYEFKVLKNLQLELNIWILIIEVQIKNKSFLFFGLYHSPSTSIRSFCD